MKNRRRWKLLWVAMVLVGGGGGVAIWRMNPASEAVKERVVRTAVASPAPAHAPNREVEVSVLEQRRERAAYAQRWDRELTVSQTAFRDWTKRYLAAAAGAPRASLEAEGLALAQARRPELLRLIKLDPASALAVTVPMTVRRVLPAAVLAELEVRVAGTGDFTTIIECEHPPGTVRTGPDEWRSVTVGAENYVAHTYGRREGQLTKLGASLHGIALGRDLALHESPVRILEPGEAKAAAAGRVWVAAFGREYDFAEEDGAALGEFVRNAEAAEDKADPRVAGPHVPPAAAEPSSSRTVGPQTVLVIRADFSDFPGASVTASEAQATMDGNVREFLESASYGQTTIVTTVSSKVYRLPQTGSAYALADNAAQLHTDARSLAAADFTLTDFQRIVVTFPSIGTARVPGSLITFAGQANRAGPNIWMNGAFGWQTMAHELGHSYGILHANLWRAVNGDPLSAAGTTLEYGDPFDMMGSSTATNVTRDARHHFNPRFKNILGWLSDSAVATVTTSGTYRVFRFDHPASAALKQPMALRIFRDGVRSYWIGYRQNFSTGSLQTQGAYITWAYGDYKQSQLLDLTTPGVSANDAVLAVGQTFTDPIYGITIKPVGRGGAEAALYLDIEVTIPPAPPGVAAAWGRDGASFFAANTGELVTPVPETAVPQNLTEVRQIAAGDAHALALKTDGSVVAWGNNVSGQISVPTDLGNDNVAVAAGGQISGVVRRDGTVRLWGSVLGGVTTPPAGLTGVTQLVIGGSQSVGIYHALALKSDGTLVGWGDNSRGQATPPGDIGRVIAVAANDRGSVALKADGTVVRWGTNFTGALPLPAGLNGITAIATHAAAAHTLALRADGTVVAWGINSNAQATVPAGLRDVVAIATGQFHSLALKADGSVVGWGVSGNGRLSVPENLPRSRAVAASANASFAISGAHLYLTGQPQAQVAAVGGSARLYVQALGAGALAYQWRKNGVAIPGATADTLNLGGLTTADAAGYDVVVSDAGSGTRLTSAAAAITLAPAGSPGRLSSLSVLTSVTAESPFFTVGTAIGGAGTSGTKPVLLRAAGPALTKLGVGGVLADPSISLYSDADSVTPLAVNDDWAGAPVLTAAFGRLGAFPFESGVSKDAAIFREGLPAGGYTVQVRGVAGATGTVIAELYDGTAAASFAPSTTRLVGVSVLKQIEAGEILTVGFVVGGTTSRQVLVRAIGPALALAPFNIPTAMADPRLNLFNLQTQAVIQSNDNWGGAALLRTTAGRIGSFPVENAASRDAMLTATLTPGSYTVQVSGANSASGLTLVEVYEVP